MGNEVRLCVLGKRRLFPVVVQSTKEGLVNRVVELATAVHEGVQLIFHLCQGDLGHQHFIEPRDRALLVNVANMLSRRVRGGSIGFMCRFSRVVLKLILRAVEGFADQEHRATFGLVACG